MIGGSFVETPRVLALVPYLVRMRIAVLPFVRITRLSKSFEHP